MKIQIEQKLYRKWNILKIYDINFIKEFWGIKRPWVFSVFLKNKDVERYTDLVFILIILL